MLLVIVIVGDVARFLRVISLIREIVYLSFEFWFLPVRGEETNFDDDAY